MDEKKDEVQTLVDEVEVDGFKVRPWGICDLARLSPTLERVVKGLKDRKVTMAMLKDKKQLDEVIFAVLPELPDLLAISLKLPISEIEKLPNEKALKLALVIVKLNVEYLKNWLGPATAAIKSVMA
jgi:hypothetical protein